MSGPEPSPKLASALLDPTSVFRTPEDVLACADLTNAGKIAVLRCWARDAIELENATSEGMPGGESDLLDRIQNTLRAIDILAGPRRSPRTGRDSLPPSEPRADRPEDRLDEAEIAAMSEALEDEYKARATYRAVIARFGPVRPFSNIVEAEGRHAEALLTLFDRFGLVPPQDRWAGAIEPPESLEDACAAAVAAEIENADMYDRLLGQVAHPAVRRVLLRLQAASRDNHLPAFRRCLLRDGGPGRSPGGQGRRRGRD